jgi:pSer/pThr/pTyr-binding forkhead associated (FHA) protein
MTDISDLQFPINQALLEEATKIKQERLLVRERIAKIEAKKNEVSPTVYQKVKLDYQQKLNQVTEQLLEKKTDIDRELSTLYETRTKVSENLEQHKETLAELKFRSDLGEYSDKEFGELSNSEGDKITKFEKILSAVNSNIERYESIFADEEDMLDSNIEPSVKKKKTKAEKNIQPPGLIEDAEYELDAEEKDYFSPETEEEAPVDPEQSTDVTKKTSLGQLGEPRVIVIEGEQTGHEYKLKKETTIGRANTNMIVLKDGKVSRQHAIIKQTGNEFVLLDLNSSNGVLVNHEKVKEHVLGDGDQIQIGDHVMQFKL